MKLSGTRDRLVVEDADLSGSRFRDVSLSRTTFHDVDLCMGVFTNTTLKAARIENADLTDVALSDCRLAGATIDGIPVEAMIAAYRKINPPTD